MGNLDNLVKVGHVVPGIADALEVDGFCVVVDELLEVVRVVSVDELCVDAEARERDLELVVGAAVEVRGRDDVVAGMGEGGNGHELRRLAGSGRDSRDAALERRHAFLEHIHGRLST